ncbi:MAG: CPBP family intramembrane metalloprotease [Candidatus Nomurabacteria bacterium]|jgi:membrane protease YdiL (CAAX protease family)|nr:CPBP family intramembrane metalloprotease [Candidatus Nomurabacteria bacterium]
MKKDLSIQKNTKPINKKTNPKLTWKTFSWALLMLLWVAIALIASQFVVSFILVSLLGVETVVQPVWSTLYSALVYILCLFLVIFIPWKLLKMKTNRDELGLTGLPTWTDIGLAPIGFIVYFILSMVVVALIMAILPNVNWDQAQDVGFQNLIYDTDKILAFVALVILAPIAEEIIFRGWLYGKIRSKMPAWLSILLVSILFGVMHGQWNVAVNVFCMSVVMCLLREITGTIWSSIMLHMLKNGVAFYFLFINPML